MEEQAGNRRNRRYNSPACRSMPPSGLAWMPKRVLGCLPEPLRAPYRLITYPDPTAVRLPSDDHFNRAPQVRDAIAATAPTLASAVARRTARSRSKAWNDGKVDAHHAIIPTETWQPGGQPLRRREPKLYGLVARRGTCCSSIPVRRWRRRPGVAASPGGLFRPGPARPHPQGGAGRRCSGSGR